MHPNSQVKTYVYIHGAMGSSHDLDYVKPVLEAAGHTLITVDLPGHGADNTPATEITLNDYIAKVEGVLQQQTTPVYLLAHSFGGFTATVIADRHPDKVLALTYIAGYVPANGENMATLSAGDKESRMGSILAYDPVKKEVTIKPGMTRQAWDSLANDAPDQLKQMLASQPGKPEPMLPFGNMVSLTGAGDRVRKFYIHTGIPDKIITPPFQAFMTGRGKFEQELQIETGHMPFVTQPQKLAELIMQID